MDLLFILRALGFIWESHWTSHLGYTKPGLGKDLYWIHYYIGIAPNLVNKSTSVPFSCKKKIKLLHLWDYSFASNCYVPKRTTYPM